MSTASRPARSTGKVEQLGLQAMSKDTVSRLCRGLDEQVTVFGERPVEGADPYRWLDAKVERVREAGGVRHQALVIADGVHASGRREVVGIEVGEPRPTPSGLASCGRCAPVGWTGSSWSSPTPTPAWSRPSPRWWAASGGAAPSSSSGTCSATSLGPSSRWGRGDPPDLHRGLSRRGAPATWAGCRPAPPHAPRSPGCWRTPRLTGWPARGSRPSTGPSWAPPSAGAGQPRDRPALGCGGDLPQ